MEVENKNKDSGSVGGGSSNDKDSNIPRTKKHLGVLLSVEYFEKLRVLMKVYRQVSLTNTVRVIIEDVYTQWLSLGDRDD